MESSAVHVALGVGEMLNWYRIERVLGRGGFGVIYLATDTNLDCAVAIKEYLPPGVARRAGDTAVEPLTDRHGELYRWGLERFIKEARNLVRFKHPNIVRVMSVFQQNNTAYMVMEFEAGENLCRHLERPGTTGEARLRALAGPLCDGLGEVHRHGFIHRDVKPANVLVRPDGSPVLLDFGSARLAARLPGDPAMTALVSIGYAPLEQYDDGDDEQQGPWTDIYALGGVLYYGISGGSDPVDSARRGAALLNGARDPMIPATVLGAGRYSHGFLAAVDWALEHRIADRPQTLSDWRPALLGDAVAVDVEERHRALDTSPVTRGGSRRSRRFEDRDEFGSALVPARPLTGAGPGQAGRSRADAARRTGPAGPPAQAIVPATPAHVAHVAHVAPPVPTARRHAPPGTRPVRTAGADRPGARGAPVQRAGSGVSRTRAVVALSALVGGVGVLWFASEQSSGTAAAARARAAAEARTLASERAGPDAAGIPGDSVVPVAPEASLATAEPPVGSPDTSAAESSGAPSAVTGVPERAPGRTESDGEMQGRDDAAVPETGADERAAAVARAADEARAAAERRRADEARALRTRTERLAAEGAVRRDTALRARYEAALGAAGRLLAAGDLTAASTALGEARATGRRDERLAGLAAQLASAQEDRRRPVTDEEFERVVRSFDELKRAIEAKDLATIERITESSGQNSLFAQLMGGFEAINMEITGIRVRNAGKSVTANLRIRDMLRANGDRAVPSPRYRDRDITSRLVGGQWSRIEW